MPKAAEEDFDGGILEDPVEEEVGQEDADVEGEEDADAEGGEAEAPAEAEDASVDDGVAAKPPTRGERRFQNLSRALKEQKERSDRLEQQLQAAANRQPEQRRETPQEREARFALMSPEERMETRFNEAHAQQEQRLQAMAIQQQNMQDLSNYQAKATANPRMARYASEVEQEFQKQVQRGSFVSREVLYHYILGKKVDSQAPGAKKTQAAAGRRAIQRQTTRPTNGRADVQANRRGSKTAADRLADIPI